MFGKLKKIAAVIAAAAICLTVAAAPVSAAEKKSVWSETKALTTAKYNSKYIKWLEKYSEKEAKNTVTYSKSRTKKFVDKIDTKLSKDGSEFSFYMINKESILAAARKDDKFKIVSYDKDMPVNIVLYADKDNETMLIVEDKLKISTDMSSDYTPEYGYLAIADALDPDVKADAKGKFFKFKSDDKTYYYEEFESKEFGSMGYLFNEKGTPIAMGVGGDFYCIKLSYSADASEFKIPKEYKEADMDELVDLLDKLS
ncbi:MAG: hypothetical protein K2J11_04110 [Oscillospiraceae bacterium]|nr:hypothetical protein [Oscillospiraceae bacterium]